MEDFFEVAKTLQPQEEYGRSETVEVKPHATMREALADFDGRVEQDSSAHFTLSFCEGEGGKSRLIMKSWRF
jgi:hypothetical protein